MAVDDGQKQLTIKLVPRIDLQAIAKKFVRYPTSLTIFVYLFVTVSSIMCF